MMGQIADALAEDRDLHFRRAMSAGLVAYSAIERACLRSAVRHVDAQASLRHAYPVLVLAFR